MGRFFRNIVKRYLGEDISYERKISIVFILSIIVAAVGAIIVYILQGVPLLIQLPTFITLIACVIVLLTLKADNFKPLTVLMFLIMFLYLPYAYFTSGALDSPTPVFFVTGIFMFGFIIKGKAKILIIAPLAAFYAVLLFIGAYLPPFEYESPFERGFDFAISFSVIAVMAIMATTIINVAIKVKENKTLRLMEELQEKNRELEVLSIIDPLTGCYNRRFLYDNCFDMLETYIENDLPFSLMMIDIDHFKEINDNHGHDVGDDILRLLCNTVRATIRLHDLMIRYGGEEFVIVLPNCDRSIGLDIAERIRHNVQESKTRENVKFTVSIGFTTYEENDTLDTMISRADNRMYTAKNNGRNQVV